MVFEWQSIDGQELLTAEEIPDHPDAFVPCYGYRYRTVSYPEAMRRIPRETQKYPMCLGKEVWSDYHLLQYQATQIGRAPFFIQRDDNKLPGQPLCSISTVCIVGDQPYPLIDRPEPVPIDDAWDLGYFSLGDTGCIYISIDQANDLHWGWSCY